MKGIFIYYVYPVSLVLTNSLLLQYLKIILAQLDISIDDADMVFQAENNDRISGIARIQRSVAALFQKLLRFINGKSQTEAEHDHLVARDVFRRLAGHDLIAIAAVHAGFANDVRFCQLFARQVKVDQLAQ